MAKAYPEFSSFKKDFIVDEKFIEQLAKYAEKEDPTLTFNKEDYKESEKILKLRIKAILAQNLWGYPAIGLIVEIHPRISIKVPIIPYSI